MNMTNETKLRLATNADVMPTMANGQNWEEFKKEVGLNKIELYGTIGYNTTIHVLRTTTYNINGEEVIFFSNPVCGTATRDRVTSINFKANQGHVNCEKCLKKLAKMGV
jgi:hypothetical protein